MSHLRPIDLLVIALLAFATLLATPARAAEEAVLDLYLARHGLTDWNVSRRIQGSTDNPLNDMGRKQAVQLGVRLDGVAFDKVYTSGLVRARETARIAAPQAPADALPALNERSFGRFEGGPEDGSDAALLVEFKRRSADPDDALDGGESLSSQSRRVGVAVQELVARHARGSVLVVSHGGVTPLILARLLDLPPAEAVARIRQANDEVYLVRIRGGKAAGVWKLVGREALEQL